MSRPVVLITGTSSGVGLKLAEKLYRSNYHVIATLRARSKDKHKEHGLIEHEHFKTMVLDVSDAANRKELIDTINQKWGGVDILVNNAGISYRAVVEHMTPDEEVHQMQTNYLGPMELIRLVLPGMRAKCGGKIINVSSVGGMMAMPTMSSYSASKFALEGASEALWYELRPWNIRVSLIQPGFIRSRSFMNVYYSELSASCSKDSNDPYCQYYADMAPFVAKLMERSPTTADDVACTIIRAMKSKNPPLRLTGSFDAHIFYWLRRLLPRRFYHWFLYRNLPGVKKWEQQSICAQTARKRTKLLRKVN